jgi:hypothetical protein
LAEEEKEEGSENRLESINLLLQSFHHPHSFIHSVSQSVISPLNCCAHHHCTSLQAWIAARIAVVHATGITEHHKLPGSH